MTHCLLFYHVCQYACLHALLYGDMSEATIVTFLTYRRQGVCIGYLWSSRPDHPSVGWGIQAPRYINSLNWQDQCVSVVLLWGIPEEYQGVWPGDDIVASARDLNQPPSLRGQSITTEPPEQPTTLKDMSGLQTIHKIYLSCVLTTY